MTTPTYPKEVLSVGVAGSESERELLLKLGGVFRDRTEQQRYMADGWKRMLIVMETLSGLASEGLRDVLELGANPYTMTLMMKRRFDFSLELANYFGEPLDDPKPVQVGELNGVKLEFPFSHFNIERDVFPYQDERFDCVLFCEILEHLLESPDHVVAEISRVLRPGGYVILSTPNATRLTNLYFLLLGLNIWDWYSPNGVYGRHNREFTLAEVRDLLEQHGFRIAHSDVQNIQPLARRFTYLQRFRPDVWNEHLFVVGQRP